MLAETLQNAMGAVGVAVLVVAVAWGAGIPTATLYTAGGIAGAVVFGLASFVRSFRDEWQLLLRWYVAQRNSDELRQLRAMVNHYEIQEQDPYALVNRALAEHYLQGQSLSYDAMRRRGWTRSQWQLVHDILVDAGVKDRSGQMLVAYYDPARQAIAHMAQEGIVWQLDSRGKARKAYAWG